MKQNCLPVNKRGCPHCSAKNTLAYYHEYGDFDRYYCGNCYGIVIWNGENVIRTEGEAYPDRDK